MFFYLILVLSSIMILFSIMFITLLERKFLGYSQNRIGPNKVTIMGLIQPLLDGVKLMFKEWTSLLFSNKLMFLFSPILIFLVMLIMWFLLPTLNFNLNFKLMVMMFLVCLGLSVYVTLLSGWVSNSKFSFLGAIRSAAQTISYEVSLAIMVFIMIFSLKTFNFLYSYLNSSFIIFVMWPILSIWFIVLLAETNRAPFDFSEGESELVSGFNTEYESSLFAILFVGEYGLIIFFSLFLMFMIMQNMVFIFCIFMSLMLIFRSCYPRYRYDKLMFLTWFKILPSVIIMVFIVVQIF